MGALPETLRAALGPVTVVVGHYGVGKTNFACNLAVDLRESRHAVTLIDVDIVNPYFRASEQRALLERHGVRLVAPVFAEAGSSLDVPSLTGQIGPAIQHAGSDEYVIIDAGGDDAGATALGRYARFIDERGYAMLYVLNRFRNLVQDPADAVENLREVETAARLQSTALVNNSHLKDATDTDVIEQGGRYAQRVAELTGLPLVCTTVPAGLEAAPAPNAYSIQTLVKTVWE